MMMTVIIICMIQHFTTTHPTIVSGDRIQQNEIRLRRNEFRDIFSDVLPDRPADVPPHKFVVDEIMRASLKTVHLLVFNLLRIIKIL